MLSIYEQQAATRLVKHNQVAKLLTAFAGTSHYSEQRSFPSVLSRLPSPTADPVQLTHAAHQLLPMLENGTRYARAGIMLTDLRPAAVHQPLEMFRHAHEEAGITELVDKVQRKSEAEISSASDTAASGPGRRGDEAQHAHPSCEDALG